MANVLTCAQYIFRTSDYWLQLPELWTNWPDREMDGLFKWYYLVQFAFWLQQIVVVNIEERRKDHVQMFTHHLVTCSLIFGSYGYHYVKVGNVILCIMDSVDSTLAVGNSPIRTVSCGVGLTEGVHSLRKCSSIWSTGAPAT